MGTIVVRFIVFGFIGGSGVLKPYVAVILDSFHAAFASRILWIAFVAIWLVLACLAPIGIREDFTTSFRIRDFENGTRLKAMLAGSLVDPAQKDSAVARIANATPEELRRQLERVGQGDEVRIHLQLLADSLNDLLDRNDWYDEDAWRGTTRLRERRELEERGFDDLNESERRRLSRLRIEAVVPGVFKSRSSRSILLTYAGMDFPATFAVDKTQFTSLINQWVVPTIINWLLGFIVIFLGILVTASIVPDMLEAGSLHLLLSKPVSRTLLLLAKFFGGCVFVFLCVTQLVVGLWLIAGLRLDVWNARMLWCIPVCVFLFAVFYSVSVVAGLRWRSPILAIGLTCMFGAVCLVVGIIGGLFDNLVSGPTKIRDLARSGNALMGSTAGGGLVRFDEVTNRWADIFETDTFSGDRVLPPVALPNSEFLAAQVRGGRFNPFGSGSLDLVLLSPTNNWEPVPTLRLPTATIGIETVGPDRLMAINANGLALTSIADIRSAAGELVDGDSNDESSNDLPGWIAKLSGMMGGVTSGFQAILPPGVSFAPPRRVVVAKDGSTIWIASSGRLYRLTPNRITNDPIWMIDKEVEIEGEASETLVMASNSVDVLVARAKEPLRIFDAKTLEQRATIAIDPGLVPVRAVSLGEKAKAFVLLSGDARCRIVSASDHWGLSQPTGPSEVETIKFDGESNHLMVVHHVDQIDELDLGDQSTTPRSLGKIVRTIRPSMSKWRLVERYAINPLRMIIPQTGELGETVAAIVSGQSTASIDQGDTGDEPQIIRYRILRPVLSCAGFIVVMLSISCAYFSTRDF